MLGARGTAGERREGEPAHQHPPLLAELGRRKLRYDHLAFPDHHRFSSAEARRIQARQRVLTTAKDATRLGAFLDTYWVIGVSHHFGAKDLEILERELKEL